MSTALIEQSFDNTIIYFQSDAYINATKAARHFNKKVGDYLRLERTQEYINELSVAGNPVTDKNQLVIKRQGGSPEEQGTWLHPKLTIDFARWLSAKFAVWCDLQIENILHPSVTSIKQKPEPKTKKALPGGLTLEMQDEIKTLITERVENELPKEKWCFFSQNLESFVKVIQEIFDHHVGPLAQKSSGT